jgi:hypothetical protein
MFTFVHRLEFLNSMKNPFRILSAIGLAILFASAFQSCETDVDLAAPYKSTSVVIGVLDFQVDTQFFRINRTFLGEGNVNVYAGIRDSVEFPDGEVEAWLIKKLGNDILDSVELLPIDLPSRDPGVFYNTDVRFFYTAEPLFTEEEIAALRSISATVPKPYYDFYVKAGGAEHRANATFPVVNASSIVVPLNSPVVSRRDFYSSTGNGAFRTQNFRYVTNATVGRYEIALRTNYHLDFEDGSTLENQFIDFRLETRDNLNTVTNGERNLNWNPGNWYDFIGRHFRAMPGLKKVRIENLQYLLTGADDDLSRYIAVAAPVSQFVPVLSTYTNLDNGAIGIVGTVGKEARIIYLDEPSMEQLNNGPLTSGPCYCGSWTGSAWQCTVPANDCP